MNVITFFLYLDGFDASLGLAISHRIVDVWRCMQNGGKHVLRCYVTEAFLGPCKDWRRNVGGVPDYKLCPAPNVMSPCGRARRVNNGE